MHQGNWKCSKCGGSITELPFQPRSEAGLTCRTCYAKGRDSKPVADMVASEMGMPAGEIFDIPDFADVASEPMPSDDFGGAVPVRTEKSKVAGNWQCSGCGGVITSLPFTPRDTSNLKCLDCYKRSRA